MKVSDIFKPVSNRQKAKQIRAKAKDKAKKNNRDEDEPVHGWYSDPHQGSHVSNFLYR